MSRLSESSLFQENERKQNYFQFLSITPLSIQPQKLAQGVGRGPDVVTSLHGPMRFRTQVCVHDTVRPNKLNRQRLEQGKVYCRARQEKTGGSRSKNPELLEGFQRRLFKGQVRAGRPMVCDQLVHNSF